MNWRIDLREVPQGKLLEALAAGEQRPVLITAWQWTELRKHSVSSSRNIMVVVPDFLAYARQISTGQPAQIARMPQSIADVGLSALSCVPTGIKKLSHLVKGDFWAGAEALLSYDLGLLRGFSGTTLLHSNLTDFALLFNRRDFLQNFARRASKRGEWGLVTQQVPSLLSACARWQLFPDCLIYPVGFSRSEADLVSTAREQTFTNCRATIDLTQWPADLIMDSEKRTAFCRPGDDEYLINIATASEAAQSIAP